MCIVRHDKTKRKKSSLKPALLLRTGRLTCDETAVWNCEQKTLRSWRRAVTLRYAQDKYFSPDHSLNAPGRPSDGCFAAACRLVSSWGDTQGRVHSGRRYPCRSGGVRFHTFFDEIAKDVATRAYVGGQAGGVSESPTVSAVGYNSLLTGTWANKHRVYSNQIRSPDYRYWDIFRLVKQHNPDLSTALFSTWEDNRTKLLGHGRPEAGGDKLDYYFDGFENDEQRFPHDEAREYIRQIDDLVSREAARYLAEHGPDLSWVYLEFTDDIGHLYGDGDEMAAAIMLMDANVGRIWRSVQARQHARKRTGWWSLRLITGGMRRPARVTAASQIASALSG